MSCQRKTPSSVASPPTNMELDLLPQIAKTLSLTASPQFAMTLSPDSLPSVQPQKLIASPQRRPTTTTTTAVDATYCHYRHYYSCCHSRSCTITSLQGCAHLAWSSGVRISRQAHVAGRVALAPVSHLQFRGSGVLAISLGHGSGPHADGVSVPWRYPAADSRTTILACPELAASSLEEWLLDRGRSC